MMNPEKVHTMTGWYDGPRSGIADYLGRPHAYESLWSTPAGGCWTDLFYLMPVDDETFALAMEDWQIWLRWEQAFHSGQATQETHPALPSDLPRHQHLQALLIGRLEINPHCAILVRGKFGVSKPATIKGMTSASLEVQWEPAADSTNETILYSELIKPAD